MVAKAWRFYVESTEHLHLILILEPWYWFVFLNLILTLISANFDYSFVMLAFLVQLTLCGWFALSIRWIVKSCPHKTAILHNSWFVKGKTIRFCYRCGTRLPNEVAASLVKDSSWQTFLFQAPPHLFNYVLYWIAQSAMVLISLFLALRIAKYPNLQHQVVIGAVILVMLVPPLIYFLGRFRRYLTLTKGMIWWDDIRSSILAWTIGIALVWTIFYLL
jgi:hypothetical protein